MPRALLLCSTIVAVFQLQLAAEMLVEDAPVPGSVIVVATELGMEPPFDRARFMSELIRLLYMPRDGSPSASDRKSTRLNSSHMSISYAVFCLKKKKDNLITTLA